MRPKGVRTTHKEKGIEGGTKAVVALTAHSILDQHKVCIEEDCAKVKRERGSLMKSQQTM